MKDSGVEWIGEIPKGWVISRVKDNILSITSGTSVNAANHPASPNQAGVLKTSCVSDYIFIPEENKEVNIEEYHRLSCPVQKGSLIVSRMNTPVLVGACGYVEKDYNYLFLPDRLWQVRFNDKSIPKFFFYALSSAYAKNYYSSIAVGTSSSMQNISKKDFGDMSCFLPPHEEQRKIADFLDAKCAEIDKVVEQTRATIEEYKKLKQAIITEAVTKGVRGARPMKPSGVEWIGDIPEDWSMKRFKYLGIYRNGLTYKPEDMVDTGTLVLRSSNIQNGQIVLDDNVYVSCAVRDELKVRKGDILICSRNGSRELIGKNAIIKDDMEASFGAFMMIFRSDSPEYVRYILNSSVFSYYLASFFTATINQLTASNFGNMKVPFCCDLIEQKEIVAFLDTKCAEIDRIIEKKEQLIEELGSYKKSLIYEYVTGKKEVTA